MVSKSIGKYSRVSPYKARLVANMIKGKNVEVAAGILAFSPQKASKFIEKILKSAVSNAEYDGLDTEKLFVGNATVDEGPMVKRFDPRAMGRAVKIRQRTSHITIELDSK